MSATHSGTVRVPSAAGAIIQAVEPTNGRILGWVALVVSALVIVLNVIQGVSWGVLAVAFTVMTLAWTVMLRPRALLCDNGLVLANIVIDRYLPWSLIESVSVRQTLRVVANGKVYHGVSEGQTMRQQHVAQRRQSRTSDQMQTDSMNLGGGSAGGSPKANTMAYSYYIVSNIQERASASPTPTADDKVRTSIALDSLPLLVITVAVIVLAFVL